MSDSLTFQLVLDPHHVEALDRVMRVTDEISPEATITDEARADFVRMWFVGSVLLKDQKLAIVRDRLLRRR